MRGQVLKMLLFLNILFLGSFLVLPIWYTMEKGLEKHQRNVLQSTDSCNLRRERSTQFIDFCSRVSQTEEPDNKLLSEPIKEEPEKTDDKKQAAKPCKGCSEPIKEEPEKTDDKKQAAKSCKGCSEPIKEEPEKTDDKKQAAKSCKGCSEPIKEEPEKTDDKKQAAKPCKGCRKGKSETIPEKEQPVQQPCKDCSEPIKEEPEKTDDKKQAAKPCKGCSEPIKEEPEKTDDKKQAAKPCKGCRKGKSETIPEKEQPVEQPCKGCSEPIKEGPEKMDDKKQAAKPCKGCSKGKSETIPDKEQPVQQPCKGCSEPIKEEPEKTDDKKQAAKPCKGCSEPIKEEPEKTDDKKQAAKPCKGCSKSKSETIPEKEQPVQQPCKDCRNKITEMLKPYSNPWKRQEEKHEELRTQLNLKVGGHEKGIVTQKNTLVGSILATDGDKRRIFKVKSEHFDTFLKESPFANKTYSSCSVVGNAGILANSRCGKNIDSSEFVIRCNLPPLRNGYEKHVGVKTDLVTANPSILLQKYDSLLGSRRKFMEKLCQYGSAMILLPAFSYVKNIALCMRTFHTIQDFGSPMQPIYFNPEYLQDLDTFWRSQGWEAKRLSTGMIVTSLALELCDTVDLYGFWPFGIHPQTYKELTNHYYDDLRGRSGFHAMPEEFKLLLQLHSEGILRLHLGDCESNGE